ncbi:hypothetical protein [Nonomuraea jiangxiensis]|uniref:Uncharacterized protein n=1 Tax=Nonomuraea jiangxiensis TaxID=633440 RepID=A0A1G8Y5E5_9ACTN|nr:hypothetical protein [Nonomuraea jiangxiensis]SDJ97375.1 hypothetical protein SAMN05421869_113160 [Nonomuraea jiangxiensis]
MDYIDDGYIDEWMRAGRAHRVEADFCTAFHGWLRGLPWLPSRVDWTRLSHTVVDCSPLTDREIVVLTREHPIGRHTHLLVMYAPDQPGIVCEFDTGIGNLDLLYWTAPGARYFCGASLVDGVLVPSHEYFGEFDGHTKIRLHTPATKAPARQG